MLPPETENRESSLATAANQVQGRDETLAPLASTSLNQTVRQFELPPPDEENGAGTQPCHWRGSRRRAALCHGLSVVNRWSPTVVPSSVKREPSASTTVLGRNLGTALKINPAIHPATPRSASKTKIRNKSLLFTGTVRVSLKYRQEWSSSSVCSQIRLVVVTLSMMWVADSGWLHTHRTYPRICGPARKAETAGHQANSGILARFYRFAPWRSTLSGSGSL
jgi:hypothetical protein